MHARPRPHIRVVSGRENLQPLECGRRRVQHESPKSFPSGQREASIGGGACEADPVGRIGGIWCVRFYGGTPATHAWE